VNHAVEYKRETSLVVVAGAAVDGALACAVGHTNAHAVALLFDLGAALATLSVSAAMLAHTGVALCCVLSTAASVAAFGPAVFPKFQIGRVETQLLSHGVTLAIHFTLQGAASAGGPVMLAAVP